MKRKLFIGSSSEGAQIATMVKNAICKECGDWIDAEIWTEKGMFKLNNSTFDNLLNKSIIFDYAIIVATADDYIEKRGNANIAIRDNVIFEYGLFTGAMGKTNAHMLIEKSSEIPSDIVCNTLCLFENENINEKINEIISTIKTTNNSFNYRPLPSSALAVGYFDNFIQPAVKRCKKRNKKLDILIPNDLHNLENRIKDFHSDNGNSVLCCSRPHLHRYKINRKTYYDIPTTLITISHLVSNILQTDITGNSFEKDIWIKHEIENFSHTLKVLIKRNHLEQYVEIKDFNP